MEIAGQSLISPELKKALQSAHQYDLKRPQLSGDGEALCRFSGKIMDLMIKDSTQNWFAAYTHSCQEKRVTQQLSTRNIEVFLPVHRTIRHWKNGLHVPIERPLFPGYVFVKANREDKVRILGAPGVHSIVGIGREPSPLPYEEIEALQRGARLLNLEPHQYLNAGEKVLLRKGPLEGMTGFVIRQKNSVRVVLSIDLIMKSMSVEVDLEDLEVVGQLGSMHEYAC